MQRKSFTMVELLVVIGIIGLLAAMLFPVLKKVKMNAQKSGCVNNLHQIGLAVQTYVNEYNGYLPVCIRTPLSLDDPFSVANTIVIKTKEIYKCPADIEPKYDGKSYFAKYGTSYEWNTWLNGRLIDKTKFHMAGVKLNTPLLGDAMGFHGTLGRNYLYATGRVKKSLDVLIE